MPTDPLCNFSLAAAVSMYYCCRKLVRLSSLLFIDTLLSFSPLILQKTPSDAKYKKTDAPQPDVKDDAEEKEKKTEGEEEEEEEVEAEEEKPGKNCM